MHSLLYSLDCHMVPCVLSLSSEWDLSLDETLYNQTRAVSPVSSVFTYGSRGESPIKGEYLHRGDYQLASQTSYTEENAYSNVTEGTLLPIGTELRRQMSAPSFRSQSPVKSGRPNSAASSRRTSSSSSLCRRSQQLLHRQEVKADMTTKTMGEQTAWNRAYHQDLQHQHWAIYHHSLWPLLLLMPVQAQPGTQML